MHANRSLGLIVLLVVVAATAVWFVSRGDARVGPPPPPGSTAGPATPAAADPAGGPVTQPTAPDPTADPTLRVEAASASAVTAKVGAAVVGRVVDEQGRPVAGAVVRTARGPMFDPAAFDGDMFEAMANEPETAMARVRAARGEGSTTTTAADGSFRFTPPSTGRMVSLRVEARGHQVLERSVARPTSGDLDVGELSLERGAVVSGRVVDRAGQGIADATVMREPGGAGAAWMGDVDFEFPGDIDSGTLLGDRARTDAEGRFELPFMGPGEFTLRARHPDHPFTRQAGLVAAAGAELRDVVLVLEPGATIRGRVVDLPDGAPSLQVAVRSRRDETTAPAADGPLAFLGGADMLDDIGGFGERTTKVGPDGTFVVRGLRIGRAYRVWATQTGRGMLGNAACTQRLEVTTPIDGIELRYDAGITVTFQVVASGDGAPIERLWVSHSLGGGNGGMEELMSQAMGRRGRAASYPDGRVTIQNLRPKEKQTLRLSVDAVGFRPFERKDVDLPRAGQLDLGVVRLVAAPVLRVHVVAQADGAAVVGASVRVREDKGDEPVAVSFEMFGRMGGGSGTGSARTDEDGRCVVNAPADASFRVEVTSKAHAPHESAPLTLATLAGGELTVTLLRGGAVEVTAVDSEGAVAAGQRIEHLAPDGSRDSKSSSDTGVAIFERLTPGEHRFRIGDRAGGPGFVTMTFDAAMGQGNTPEAGWQPVQVDDGATATLQLTKPATAQLRGVVRENGLPLAGARVTFLKGTDSGAGGELAEMMADFGGRGGGGGRSARAGDDGSYLLRDLPEGSHRLRITASGRTMPSIVAVELRSAENVFDVDLDVAIVRGTVRDADGKPLSGATVRIAPVRPTADGGQDPMGMVEDFVPGGLEMLGGGMGGRSAKTDDRGRYELRGVQAGASLQVRATAKGSAPAASAPFEVAAGGTRDGVDLQLPSAGRIKVTAEKAPFLFASASRLDAAGKPDQDVKPVVQMLRNGSGTLDGLLPGRWRVSLRTPNGENQSPREVDVAAGETVTVAF